MTHATYNPAELAILMDSLAYLHTVDPETAAEFAAKIPAKLNLAGGGITYLSQQVVSYIEYDM